MPPGFPRNTIQVRDYIRGKHDSTLTFSKVQRVLSVVSVLHPEMLEDTIATLYRLSFAERLDISTAENLAPILGKTFGEDGTKEILAKVRFKHQ